VEKPAQATKPVAPAGARLKLDPLENLTERIKTLESATTSPPAQEVMQDTARIQQLQGDVKALLAQAAKNQENLAVMRERLEKAEAQQQPSLLTYLLLALLAASVTAIGVLWFLWRRRPVVASITQAAVPTSLTPTKPYEEPATEHVDLDDLSFEKSVTVVEARRTALLAFDEQSMLDMCQRAAFLQSVGRTDEAVALLENRIRANPKDCPLVYLQLLEALHQSARTAEYRVVRHAFMQSFNVNIPEMSSFQDKGKALEAYPGVLSRITQLWQTSKALDEITTCVIPSDHKGQVQRFDMAAFKELIMLHGLAIESQNPQKQKRPPVADSEHIQLDF
jgi:tetratricopeptide (TPR) repeat protein